MALKRAAQIPEDAVAFTDENEAAAYIWNIVHEWDSLSQTWALRYGPMILGGVNAMSGMIINSYFRTRFKLGQYGYVASTLPVCLMPGALTVLFHSYLVSTDILLMKSKPCPVCFELKSAVIQNGLGLAYPMVLAPTACLMLANRYGTYRIPDFTEGGKAMFSFLAKHCKPFTGSLIYLAAIQLIASSVITYFEMKNSYTLGQEIQKIEDMVTEKREKIK